MDSLTIIYDARGIKMEKMNARFGYCVACDKNHNLNDSKECLLNFQQTTESPNTTRKVSKVIPNGTELNDVLLCEILKELQKTNKLLDIIAGRV